MDIESIEEKLKGRERRLVETGFIGARDDSEIFSKLDLIAYNISRRMELRRDKIYQELDSRRGKLLAGYS